MKLISKEKNQVRIGCLATQLKASLNCNSSKVIKKTSTIEGLQSIEIDRQIIFIYPRSIHQPKKVYFTIQIRKYYELSTIQKMLSKKAAFHECRALQYLLRWLYRRFFTSPQNVMLWRNLTRVAGNLGPTSDGGHFISQRSLNIQHFYSDLKTQIQIQSAKTGSNYLVKIYCQFFDYFLLLFGWICHCFPF